ncbi:hypothetical protein PF008_g17282 [Phytophthora fragariae]|uniref:Uncharacterized protein n=1 Tax=Phytophthora fragariae TaxID=53985 RepID=A0A6G0RA34_9STRA|nr:hypothetical protein PF008_g17282 [Phytophthora fragariae]
MPCTGGGAHKYGYAFNEMAKRLSWRRATRLSARFWDSTCCSRRCPTKYILPLSVAGEDHTNEDLYPYLLGIGSGVSVLYVKCPGDYERERRWIFDKMISTSRECVSETDLPRSSSFASNGDLG